MNVIKAIALAIFELLAIGTFCAWLGVSAALLMGA